MRKGFTACMSPLPAWACFMDAARSRPLLAARRAAARRAPLTQLEIAKVELPRLVLKLGKGNEGKT
ncbi:hypothetical protein Dimus_023824 [Dionaea muscipula]